MINNSTISSEQLSFRGVIEKYERIIIPIMQRDYAQGRPKEYEIRQNFLQQLLGYLLSKDAYNDLDFVYGNTEDNVKCFIPLDGQQRLTTLFLLHYYLAIHDGRFNDFRTIFSEKVDNEYKSRFSYETRFSSTHFCDAIFNNEIDYVKFFSGNAAEHAISERFRDFGWFVASWECDPTIQSMLQMLDSIHGIFANQKVGLYDRLVSVDSPAITFQLLPMKDNGLNDDLYIKMNSRGLPLTRFEKIKARIIKVLRGSSESRMLSRTVDEAEKKTPIEKYFSYKIDTVWAYMFWAYKTDKKLERVIGDGIREEYHVRECDSRILNFIATIAANYQAVNGGVKALDIKLLTSSSSSSWASYESLGEAFFSHLIDCLDTFSRSYDKQGIKPYCDGLPFDIQSLFELFVTADYKDRRYQERVLFYAYYSFLILHRYEWGEEHLKQELFDWCRVIKNLTINNRYDSEVDFCNAVSFVGKLLAKTKGKGVLEVLASRETLTDAGFDERQYKEERIKAWLVSIYQGKWYENILQLEANEYLEGQIISALCLSGIESLYDGYYGNDTGAVGVSDVHQKDFERYSTILQTLFNKNGLAQEFEKHQLFRRALLSKGDFSMMANSNHCLLKNTDRDISWKRFLHQTPDLITPLKSLLDNCPAQNIANYFETIINSRTVISLIDWKGILVKTPEIWDKLDWYNDNSKRAIRAEGEGFKRSYYPLIRQRMNGEHYELRTLYKYYQLMKNTTLEPYLSLPASYSDEDEPYVLFRNDKVQFVLYFNYDEKLPWAIYIYMNEGTSDFDSTIAQKASANGYSPDSVDTPKHYDKLLTDDKVEQELLAILNLNFFC